MKDLTDKELLLVAGGQQSDRDDDRERASWEITVTRDGDGNTTITGTVKGEF
ncbi:MULTISPECIES: hypothetical protein [Serratia]|jgi:hypothetical protein|uniref:hypothetical protein n=1 Tax=Serratia TaxID=613 RepID=UPI000A4C2D55|nr:hypothetical protein [Serratia marcescens]MBF8217355.1 hypothetical protein [Serratia ureilytica]MBF4652651.1 hypothetical protein [Serratia marcescens]MBF8241901.1 hypothetical protein [Serratia ureilytica]MBH1915343.1 hypothetical protein [Serratia marcescens]MBH2675698.1 hypothetical protein [Serratia marcescens]